MKAFAPGNLSCIFVIIDNKNPAKKGSLGVGATTKEGALVKVSLAEKNEVYYNNKRIYFPTVLTVINSLTSKKIKAKIKSPLPLGCGFGMSGASALASAYALNKLLKLNKPKKELAMVAHTAEVINRTGLGDVGGQYNGLGFMIKSKKGRVLDVEDLEIRNISLYYRVFGILETKKIIKGNKGMIRKINKAGLKALRKVKKLRNLGKKEKLRKIIEISKEFSIESGLANERIIKLINKIESRGGKASMIMLGNAVYADIPFPGCRKVKIVRNPAR